MKKGILNLLGCFCKEEFGAVDLPPASVRGYIEPIIPTQTRQNDSRRIQYNYKRIME